MAVVRILEISSRCSTPYIASNIVATLRYFFWCLVT